MESGLGETVWAETNQIRCWSGSQRCFSIESEFLLVLSENWEPECFCSFFNLDCCGFQLTNPLKRWDDGNNSKRFICTISSREEAFILLWNTHKNIYLLTLITVKPSWKKPWEWGALLSCLHSQCKVVSHYTFFADSLQFMWSVWTTARIRICRIRIRDSLFTSLMMFADFPLSIKWDQM